jgi:hypothetical protein
VPNIVRTLQGSEERERGGNERIDVIEVAGPGGAQEGFQFGKGLLDRVEVWAVGREEAEERTDGLDRRQDVGLFVDRQVVEDDDVARPECRGQNLLHVRQEARVVDRSVEDGRRGQSLEAQSGDHGVCLPVTAWCVVVEALATRTAAVAPQEIRCHATFIEEHILAHVADRQPVVPLATLCDDIRPSLLVGVYGFF